MIYEPGDILKDKYTNTHFMIIKVIPLPDMNWYLIQNVRYGGTRDYNQTILDMGFDIIQRVRK